MKSLTKEYPMYYGAKPEMFSKAKELRKTETKAEKALWNRLSNHQLKGFGFRRQHPINKFIVDFYCHELKLVIEVDGSIHELAYNKEYDIERTTILNDFGIEVIRFSNEEVLEDLDSVIRKIEDKITLLLSSTPL